MTMELTKPQRNEGAAIMERVLLVGDLAKLSPDERCRYYAAVCESCGLNPLTRPFEYIQLNGKLTLYARKDATDQLRKLHNVSITIPSREVAEGVYVVTARATTPDGRSDEEVGAVNIGTLKGEALANAMMKATTKSKRRVTLSICGLGLLDETELETIPPSQRKEFVESPVAPALPAELSDSLAKASPERVAELIRLCIAKGVTEAQQDKWRAKAGTDNYEEFTADAVDKLIAYVSQLPEPKTESKPPPTKEDAMAMHAQFIEQCRDAAIDAGLTESELRRGLETYVTKNKTGNKGLDINDEQKKQVLELIRNQRGYFCPSDPKVLEDAAAK